MPRPRKTVQKTQDSVDVIGSECLIKTAVKIGLSANYQSITIEAGLEYRCPADEREMGYNKAWNIVNTEVGNQLDEAKAVLAELSNIRSKLER